MRAAKRAALRGLPAPSLIHDYAFGGLLPSAVSFTRATSAWYFNSAGTLTNAGSGNPVLPYNPITLLPEGLRIEEQRTNSIRNNTMVGAAAGTPGTLPTNWTTSINTTTGLTRSVVGSGTEDGIAYVDIRLNGTASGAGSFDIAMEAANAIAAATGQLWAYSTYWRLVGGSFTGMSGATFYEYEYTSGSVFVTASSAGGATLPTSASLRTQRFTGAATLSGGATTAFVRPLLKINIANGAAIDFTLRIGLPQLELGAFATSVIQTTGAAATRNAAVATIATLSPWFNAVEGTIVVEGALSALSSTDQALCRFDDGTGNNLIFLRSTSSGAGMRAAIVSGGATQWAANTANAFNANQVFKAALAYRASDQAAVLNGGTLISNASGSVPSVSQLSIGNSSTGNLLNGWIKRIAYYPRRLPNSTLQALTA